MTERGRGLSDIDHDRQFVHYVDVGIRATPEALAAVRQVTYTFRVAFRPVYETRIIPGEKGLTERPALTSIELQIEPVECIATIGVAIGRDGDLHRVAPSFETWTVDQLREANGRLHLGWIDNRRGVPVMEVGDRRDFIWVVAIDAQGKAESYGTWRPQFLRETLSSEATEAARASEELRPFARTDPASTD